MKIIIWILVLNLFAITYSVSSNLGASHEAEYVGFESCKTCHPEIYLKWQTSLHSKVHNAATPKFVLGDFRGTLTFKALKRIEVKLSFRENRYYVKLGDREYEVLYTHGAGGWKQRYLTRIGSSLYVLPIQWNTKTKEWVLSDYEVWFDQDGNPKEPLNEDSYDVRCSGCHLTGLKLTQTKEEWVVTFKEMFVGCEACHGPGSDHVERDRTIFVDYGAQVCGRCHTRGTSLPEGIFGFSWKEKEREEVFPWEDYNSYFKEEPVIWDDGTSKMHRQQFNDWKKSEHSKALRNLKNNEYAKDYCLRCHSADYILSKGEKPNLKEAKYGITCVVCHDPHASEFKRETRSESLNLCARCHTIDPSLSEEVPLHPQIEMFVGSYHFVGGSECKNCHMPKMAESGTPFDSRIHTWEFKSPNLSLEIEGMPNSCNQDGCHFERDAKWSLERIEKWQSGIQKKLSEVEPLVEAAERALEGVEKGNEELDLALEMLEVARIKASLAQRSKRVGISFLLPLVLLGFAILIYFSRIVTKKI
ncbi:MAG: ammonia-forming cytochrome c nitrite reductase subunit c552 [Candidatus Methanofastidiosia archaeon]